MITIDCPFCGEESIANDGLTIVACDGCGVAVEVAPDLPVGLDAAA